MKRFLTLLTIILVLSLSGNVFSYQKKGILLFNTQPITKENALSDEMVFKAGQRVYYLFIAPKKMKNKFIRVQIFKMTDKAPWGGNEVVRTKDYRLMKDEKYYHTNYCTLHETGRYVMQIFSIDDFQHPLAVDFFYVK
jgi:hypothetical protein